MTTIVWKDGVLATDTAHSREVESGSKSGHSGAGVSLIYTNKSKVYTLSPPVEMFGDTIMAFAGSGIAADVERVVRLLKLGIKISEIYRVVVDLLDDDGLSIMAIGANKNYAFTLHRRNTKILEYSKESSIAIGSGKYLARYVMKNLNVSAQDAVVAAMMVDPYTNGNIEIFKFENDEFVEKKVVELDDYNEIKDTHQEMLKASVESKFTEFFPDRIKQPRKPRARKAPPKKESK